MMVSDPRPHHPGIFGALGPQSRRVRSAVMSLRMGRAPGPPRARCRQGSHRSSAQTLAVQSRITEPLRRHDITTSRAHKAPQTGASCLWLGSAVDRPRCRRWRQVGPVHLSNRRRARACALPRAHSQGARVLSGLNPGRLRPTMARGHHALSVGMFRCEAAFWARVYAKDRNPSRNRYQLRRLEECRKNEEWHLERVRLGVVDPPQAGRCVYIVPRTRRQQASLLATTSTHLRRSLAR